MEGMDKFEMNIGNEDSRDYSSPDIPLSLRFSRSASIGSNPPDNTMAIGRGDVLESSLCSAASMVDSFCTTVLDQPITSQNLGFCDTDVLNNVGSFNASAMEGTLDMVWNLPNPVLGGDISLPSSSSLLSRSLSQIPTHLDFLERGAALSCFTGGNFGEMLNSITIPGSMSQYGVVQMHGPRSINSGFRLNSISGLEVQENKTQVIEGTEDVSMSIEHGPSGGSPNSGKKTESFIRSHDEANEVQCESGSESVDAEFSTGGNQAEPSQLEGTSQGILAKGRGSKKRRKIAQVELYVPINNMVNVDYFDVSCIFYNNAYTPFSRLLSQTTSKELQIQLSLQSTILKFKRREIKNQLQLPINLVESMANWYLKLQGH